MLCYALNTYNTNLCFCFLIATNNNIIIYLGYILYASLMNLCIYAVSEFGAVVPDSHLSGWGPIPGKNCIFP